MSTHLAARLIPLGVEVRLPGWDADRWVLVSWIYSGYGRTIISSADSRTNLILFDNDVVEVRDEQSH